MANYKQKVKQRQLNGSRKLGEGNHRELHKATRFVLPLAGKGMGYERSSKNNAVGRRVKVPFCSQVRFVTNTPPPKLRRINEESSA